MPANPSPAKPRRARARAATPAPRPEAPAAAPEPAEPTRSSLQLPEPKGGWRALGFLLALCQPWAGLTLAFLYWPSPDGRGRRFSRWCLGLALLGFAVGALLAAAWNAAQNGESGVQAW